MLFTIRWFTTVRLRWISSYGFNNYDRMVFCHISIRCFYDVVGFSLWIIFHRRAPITSASDYYGNRCHLPLVKTPSNSKTSRPVINLAIGFYRSFDQFCFDQFILLARVGVGYGAVYICAWAKCRQCRRYGRWFSWLRLGHLFNMHYAGS